MDLAAFTLSPLFDAIDTASPRAFILLAALSGSLTMLILARHLDFTLLLAPPAGRTLLRYQGATETNALEQIGQSALRRLPGLGSLLDLEGDRRWLALVADPPSAAYLVGMAILLGSGGVAVAAFAQRPLLLLAALLGFLYPFARVRSQAARVRRRMERALPELTAILAAEMAAGLPPDQALERAATWTGPMATLLQQAMESARRTGRPVFGRGPTPGALVTTTEAYDLPALRAFAVQLDTAARKGAAGPALMNALVQTYIVAYQDRSLQQAEKLETRLAVPSVLFFFMPLLFLILVPMLLPLLRIL
ncbi:MAG: type II secretion system F family protein [Caldilineales bacterium]|nr:type II secretion system F family protein [Caldilineales bacterium]